jgi:hypothetical protein
VAASKNLAAEIGAKISKMKVPAGGKSHGGAFSSAAADVMSAMKEDSPDAFEVALKDAIKACLAETKKPKAEGEKTETDAAEEY